MAVKVRNQTILIPFELKLDRSGKPSETIVQPVRASGLAFKGLGFGVPCRAPELNLSRRDLHGICVVFGAQDFRVALQALA